MAVELIRFENQDYGGATIWVLLDDETYSLYLNPSVLAQYGPLESPSEALITWATLKIVAIQTTQKAEIKAQEVIGDFETQIFAAVGQLKANVMSYLITNPDAEIDLETKKQAVIESILGVFDGNN